MTLEDIVSGYSNVLISPQIATGKTGVSLPR